jgi:hypothetical protein
MDTYPQDLQISCISCSWDNPEAVTRPLPAVVKRLSELTTIKIINLSVFCRYPTSRERPDHRRRRIIKSLDHDRRFGVNPGGWIYMDSGQSFGRQAGTRPESVVA